MTGTATISKRAVTEDLDLIIDNFADVVKALVQANYTEATHG